MNSEIRSAYLSAILAGVLIGLGDIVYVLTPNHLLGAVLFSLGLLSIIIKGYPLYTGRIGYVESWRDFIHPVQGLLMILLMNFIGIALICTLIQTTRLDLSAIETLVPTKVNQSWLSALVLSWGCGVMVYLAVNGWKKTNNPLMVMFPVVFFILCGFEHCIANFGYFWMWITADHFAHFATRFAELPAGFCLNLLLMVIGNSLGSLTFSKI